MLDSKEIGRRLRLLRGDKRTLAEVSKACGISDSTLGMYESGERVPRDYIKVRLAAYYDVDVGELFYAQEYHAK